MHAANDQKRAGRKCAMASVIGRHLCVGHTGGRSHAVQDDPISLTLSHVFYQPAIAVRYMHLPLDLKEIVHFQIQHFTFGEMFGEFFKCIMCLKFEENY